MKLTGFKILKIGDPFARMGHGIFIDTSILPIREILKLLESNKNYSINNHYEIYDIEGQNITSNSIELEISDIIDGHILNFKNSVLKDIKKILNDSSKISRI